DVQHWRARSCAVLTGINTILADDAQLNVREIECVRQPQRVVLDSQLRMPLNARILHLLPSPAGGRGDGGEGGVLIYSAVHDQQKISRLTDAGATVVILPDDGGQVDLQAM
ncbi:MAG: dihydrofolate reductase family protein, partial [Gallionella sp.]